MTTLVIDAALRSVLLALAVWTALQLLRVRNVLAEKAAWTMVLAAAVVMPLTLIVAARWPGLPAPKLVLPTAIAQDAASITAPLVRTAAAVPASSFTPEPRPDSSLPAQHQALGLNRIAPPFVAKTWDHAGIARSQAPSPAPLPIAWWGAVVYLLIAGALCFRLLLGLAVTFRLWHRAVPVTVPHLAEGLRLRASSRLSTPVTIGSGVLLPAEYVGWGEEKLRVVLAHEGSHVRQGDFYLQLLASLYTAVLWLSPLGWWLKHKLSDLSEAIGDRSGLQEAASRTSYARVLLEFAAAPRPTVIGVAMARPSSLSRRMERLLNDSAFRQAFAGGRRTLLAALLAPAVLFAVTAMVRVQAASIGLAPSISAPAAALQPAATAPVKKTVQSAVNGPVTETLVLHSGNGELLAMAGSGGHAMVESTPSVAEATFDRTLTVSGKLDLRVGTGSGNIHLTRGSAGQVRIHARVRSDRAEEADQVRAIAANPPIEQDGNTIRIGMQHEDHENEKQHISIDYDIEAPAEAALDAASGSGNVTDEGVGQGAKLSTGSGNIEATGLEGGFKAETGSGNIAIEQAGEGDAKAETGSGNIDVKGVHGQLKAETGSGDIKAEGTPSSEWKLETGSGSVEFSPGNAPMNLDASTGSGRITSDRPMTLQVSSDGHSMRGQLNGGGPEVRIETGSGDVRIHE